MDRVGGGQACKEPWVLPEDEPDWPTVLQEVSIGVLQCEKITNRSRFGPNLP